MGANHGVAGRQVSCNGIWLRAGLLPPLVVAALTASLLAVPPLAARAEPDLRPTPAGARLTPPGQPVGGLSS